MKLVWLSMIHRYWDHRNATSWTRKEGICDKKKELRRCLNFLEVSSQLILPPLFVSRTGREFSSWQASPFFVSMLCTHGILHNCFVLDGSGHFRFGWALRPKLNKKQAVSSMFLSPIFFGGVNFLSGFPNKVLFLCLRFPIPRNKGHRLGGVSSSISTLHLLLSLRRNTLCRFGLSQAKRLNAMRCFFF